MYILETWPTYQGFQISNQGEHVVTCLLHIEKYVRVTLGTNQVLKEVDSSESSGERISFDLGSKCLLLSP